MNARILPLVFFLSFALSAAAESLVNVEAVGGKGAQLKRGGKEATLKAGDQLQFGDEVITDASTNVDLRLEDNSLVRVGVSTKYRLEKNPQPTSGAAWLNRLQMGVARVLVPKKKDGGTGVRFQLRTPTGTIGVRGTEFVVNYDAGAKRTVLKTLEGEVALAGSDAKFADFSRWTLVKRGETSWVGEEGKPSAPAKFSWKDAVKGFDSKDGDNAFAPLADRRTNAPRANADAAEKQAKNVKEEPQSEAPVGNTVPQQVKEKKIAANQRDVLNKQLADAVLAKDIPGIMSAIEKGGQVNHYAMQEEKNTPLHLAMGLNDYDVVKVLVEQGARVNVINDDGDTAIMTLASQPEADKEIAVLLVDSGTNLLIKNKAGQRAADIAIANNDLNPDDKKALVEYLKTATKTAGKR